MCNQFPSTKCNKSPYTSTYLPMCTYLISAAVVIGLQVKPTLSRKLKTTATMMPGECIDLLTPEADKKPHTRSSALPSLTTAAATLLFDLTADTPPPVSARGMYRQTTLPSNVVLGFKVEADKDECESGDNNDAEDIDEAIDADAVDTHFFDRCVNADAVTNDKDFSDNGRRTSSAVFCSLSTSENKNRVMIIEGWSCDKCTYQHSYPAQICAMCNANCDNEDKDGKTPYYSSSSSARSAKTMALKRECSLADEKV